MTGRTSAAERLLAVAVGACALYYTLCFLAIALPSLTYPYSLEWMEGHTLDIVQRIVEGKAVYTKPSLEYTPYIYTPYYFYVTAMTAKLFGVDFFSGRLVSLLATLGSVALLYCWVKRETADRFAAAVAGGLFLATYALSGRWFDIARIDSLFLLLTCGFLYVFYFERTRNGAWLSGILLAMAFFTKQSAIMVAAPVLLLGLFTRRSRALCTGLVAGVIIALGVSYFNLMSDGWFNFYVFDLPAAHAFDWRALEAFWTRDMLRPCGLLWALALWAIAMFYATDKAKALWYSAFCAGMIGSAYASRLHSYGHINVLMSAHFALALMGALALAALRRESDRRWGLLGHLCLLLQFAALYYAPGKLVPSDEAATKAENFLNEIAAIPGDIFATEVQHMQTRVGKTPYSYGMAMFDIMRADLGDKNAVKKALAEELETALKTHRFSAVITGGFLRVPNLQKYYRFDRKIDNPQEFVSGAVFMPSASVFVPIAPNNKTGNKPEDPVSTQ